MADKLDVYNLGERGVMLVKSPVHGADGELMRGQNAAPNPEGGLSGIRKRPGMDALNAVAAGGSILAIFNVPLPDPGSPSPPAGSDFSTILDGQYVLTNGVDGAALWDNAWLPPAELAPSTTNQCFGIGYWDQGVTVRALGATPPTAFTWGQPVRITSWGLGEADWKQEATISEALTVGGVTYRPMIPRFMVQDATYIYFLVELTTAGGAGGYWAVWRMELATKTVARLGGIIGPGQEADMLSRPSITVWNGAVWVSSGTWNDNTSKLRVYSIDPEGLAWSLDLEWGGTGAADAVGGAWLCGGGTNLWLGVRGFNNVSWLRKRTAAGVWSEEIAEGTVGVDPSPNFYPMYAWDDNVLVYVRWANSGLDDGEFRLSLAGGAFNSIYNTARNLDTNVGLPFVWSETGKVLFAIDDGIGNGDLWVFDGSAIAANLFPTGAMGAIQLVGTK